MNHGNTNTPAVRGSERANSGRRPPSEFISPSLPPRLRRDQVVTVVEEDAVLVEENNEENRVSEESAELDTSIDQMAPNTRLKYTRFKGDGSQDVDDWFGEFEAIATANQEDEASRRRVFHGLLRGEALKWYQDVPDGVRADWDELTDLFLRTFREAGGEARALGRLSKMTMKPGESVRKYGQRVKGLIQKLTSEIAQSVQVEWYVAGFPEEMGFQIRQTRPTTLAEAMEAAQNYENSAQSLRKSLGRKSLKYQVSSSKSGRKHRRRSSYSSSSSSASSSSSSEMETSSEEESPQRRSMIRKSDRSGHGKLKEVKEEQDSKELMKSIQQSLEAIKVNLAENRKPRRTIPTVRANIWCTKCGSDGHYPHECTQSTRRRVQFVDQEGSVFWAEEVEEEEEIHPVYQVIPGHGRGRGSPAGIRPMNPGMRPATIGAGPSQPTLPRYQIYSDRPVGVCYNCGSPQHYANVCPHPKMGGQGAPLMLPCQNCHQYGHDATHCPHPLQPRPIYKQVEVPPREQTALNYAHAEGVENPSK